MDIAVEEVTKSRAKLLRYGRLAKICDGVLSGVMPKDFAIEKAVGLYSDDPVAKHLDDATKRAEFEMLRTAINFNPPEAKLEILLSSLSKPGAAVRR